MKQRAPFAALALVLLAGGAGAGEKPVLTLVSTTTTRDSGLLDHLLPRFEAASGIGVRAISNVGTGQALALGRRGDADALLVHDRESEEAFLAEGHALWRRDVMYNDFVLVGPASDPAGVRGLARASEAFAKIAAARAGFVSRGDESGTHKAELRIWREAGVDPRAASGSWYRETGSGMGPTLGTADELGAYALTDRGTWLAFRRRGVLALLLEGERPLRNPYGVLAVNPARHAHVRLDLATRFADWISSAAGRAAIESFRIDGESVFHAGAPPD
jgi:tungstate transport system substrate-binding protein